MVTLHAKMASAALAYDERCRKRERSPNIYRIRLILGAIEEVDQEIAAHGEHKVRQILCNHFNDRLLDAMLKAAGLPQATLGEIRGHGANS